MNRLASSTALLSLLVLASCSAPAAHDERGDAAPDSSWASAFEARVADLDERSPGELAVYVKPLAGGRVAQHRARTSRYLSSTIKVPVAIVVLQAVESGDAYLEQELTLTEEDKVDGAGELKGMPAGRKFRVDELLERMIRHSDSSATDMLIRHVGEGRLNAFLRRHGFGPATTIQAVRRDAYAEIHPKARELTNLDFIAIQGAGGPAARMRALADRLGVDASELRASSLEEGFERYYERGLNSASMVAFGRLLEQLAEGDLLSREHSNLVLSHMEQIVTGERRIKAGLPAGTRFAQKTGTQVGRICNVGVVNPRTPDALVVAACVEAFGDQASAESLLREVGAALAESGALQDDT